jgi:hypothetical protein
MRLLQRIPVIFVIAAVFLAGVARAFYTAHQHHAVSAVRSALFQRASSSALRLSLQTKESESRFSLFGYYMKEKQLRPLVDVQILKHNPETKQRGSRRKKKITYFW